MLTSRAMVFAAVIGFGWMAVGCKGKKDEPAPATGTGMATGTATATGTGTGTGTGTATAPGTATDADLPAAVAVDEAAVHALVDAWLAAQNTGDFAKYQALYADKMEGVKRVGPQTWRFDRQGWLDDRARMFKHPMVVTASDVVIRGSATAPSVDLVQGFKQGKFADEGPKHLALHKGPQGLQIAREEMLVSSVTGAAASGPAALYLVVEIDGRPQVVIGDGDAAWGKGRVQGPFQGMHQFAMQDAPQGPGAWKGRAVAVYDADGTRCDATVGALRLLGGGTPHFGEVQAWDNQYEMGDGHVWSKGERARAIFGMGSLYLVGELAITGACKPVFAAEPTATPKIMASAVADPGLAGAARIAFRKLPEFVELQQSFADDYAGKGPWVATPTVDAFGNYLVVSASEGSGCGDFLGQLTAIYEVRAGKPVLVATPDYMRVDAIVDTDGDGKPELIGAVNDYRTVTAYLTLDGTDITTVSEVSFPFNDCGC